MSELPESVKAQLLKIAALAESGVGGERENARELLGRLCARHGISSDELLDERPAHLRVFAFSCPWEEHLLANVLLFVCQRRDLRHKKRPKSWQVLLTRAEAIDAAACWEHYRKQWKEEAGLFLAAFVHRHSLFGPPPAEKSMPAAEDVAQVERMVRMMRGLSSDTWKRPVAQLEAGR